MVPVVTVAGLLHSRPEAIGLPLELLSGEGGLERGIASPHIQKTGLALTGFDEYLRPARILVFGESEVRYLESLPAERRLNTLASVFSHDIPVCAHHGRVGSPDRVAPGGGALSRSVACGPTWRHLSRSPRSRRCSTTGLRSAR